MASAASPRDQIEHCVTPAVCRRPEPHDKGRLGLLLSVHMHLMPWWLHPGIEPFITPSACSGTEQHDKDSTTVA